MGLSAFSIRNNTSAVTKPINQAPPLESEIIWHIYTYLNKHQYGYHVGHLKGWEIKKKRQDVDKLHERNIGQWYIYVNDLLV